jgi:site-specific DNA-methyltransferase (adenine-specific)
MVLQIKNTQHATQKVYKFVPIQDFSEPWTDERLYAKYGLSPDETAFIESMIRPMDASGVGAQPEPEYGGGDDE